MADENLSEIFTHSSKDAMGGLAGVSECDTEYNSSTTATQTSQNVNSNSQPIFPSSSNNEHRSIAMKRAPAPYFEETIASKQVATDNNSAFSYDPLKSINKPSTEFIMDENMDDILKGTPGSIIEQGGDEDEEDDDDSSSITSTSKRSGRRKIRIEYIEEKSRRHITFSKRKAGIMKKAYELSTLTGTQVLLLVASETGHVYTFATPKLQPLITKAEGKNLIQACLNAPDNAINEYSHSPIEDSGPSPSSLPSDYHHHSQHSSQTSSQRQNMHLSSNNGHHPNYDDVMNSALSAADQQLTQKLQLAAHFASNQYVSAGKLSHVPNYPYNTNGQQNVSNEFIDNQYNTAIASAYWPNQSNVQQVQPVYHQNALQSHHAVFNNSNGKNSKGVLSPVNNSYDGVLSTTLDGETSSSLKPTTTNNN